MRARQAEAALERLERRGRLTTADNADALRSVMVTDWYEARAGGEAALMLGARREVVADLNRRARELLVEHGELGAEVMRVDELCFSVGDEVMAHHNDYDLGLLNGQRGVVRGGDERGVLVDFGDRRVGVPRDYIEEGYFSHAYASTIHKAQGLSTDAVFVLGDDSFTAEVGYTA